jgi:hypothetical protein
MGLVWSNKEIENWDKKAPPKGGAFRVEGATQSRTGLNGFATYMRIDLYI